MFHLLFHLRIFIALFEFNFNKFASLNFPFLIKTFLLIPINPKNNFATSLTSMVSRSEGPKFHEPEYFFFVFI